MGWFSKKNIEADKKEAYYEYFGINAVIDIIPNIEKILELDKALSKVSDKKVYSQNDIELMSEAIKKESGLFVDLKNHFVWMSSELENKTIGCVQSVVYLSFKNGNNGLDSLLCNYRFSYGGESDKYEILPKHQYYKNVSNFWLQHNIILMRDCDFIDMFANIFEDKNGKQTFALRQNPSCYK
jgi:hypothetical protein